MKYTIGVTEAKTYYYEVEAEQECDAIDKAEELWNKGTDEAKPVFESDLSFDNSFVHEVCEVKTSTSQNKDFEVGK